MRVVGIHLQHYPQLASKTFEKEETEIKLKIKEIRD